MLKVTPIPIFNDNYVWAIHEPDGSKVSIVDPGDASPVIEFLQANDLHLQAILITHSHFDHISGIDALLAHQIAPVYGPVCSAISQVDRPLAESDNFLLWDAEVSVMEVPGHLPEHLCYVIRHKGATQVFSGDILFSSGCGRIFSGSHRELKHSLDRLKALPQDTLVYGAHEYTQSNIRFAKVVEPTNADLLERELAVEQMRNDNTPTLPTTIGLEQRVNPFLRCDQPEVKASAESKLNAVINNELSIFKTLRTWKDSF